MRNTQSNVEDKFDDNFGKEDVSPEQVTKLNTFWIVLLLVLKWM